MLALANSTEKVVSPHENGRPPIRNIRLPHRSIKDEAHIAKILTYPKHYRENLQPVSDPFIEDLIQRNILGKNSYPRGDMFAVQARAFFNVLPEKHKKLFSEVVQAFNQDEKNLEMLKGAIFSGGEMRVIAEAGPAIAINTLTELLGVTYSEQNKNPTFNTFAGTSAGSYPAVAFASRVRNSDLFKMSAYYDFTKFYRSPETVEKKFDGCARKGIYFATGKKIPKPTVEDINNLGSDLEVLLAEKRSLFRRLMSRMPRVFLAPRDVEERYGIDPKTLGIGELARKTSNLIFLFWNPGDKTCGDCSFEDSEGTKHYIYDPGAPAVYTMPLTILEEEIKKYKNGEIEKPAFYFLVGNRRTETAEMPEQLFGKPTPKLTYWVYCNAVNLIDLYDKYWRGDTAYHIDKLGGNESYLEASCEVKDSKTQEPAKMGIGEFNLSPRKREILVYENILIAIEQMHEQLVDANYLQGIGGRSPYEIYLDDINRSIGKPSKKNDIPLDQSGVVFAIKQAVKETTSVAASL